MKSGSGFGVVWGGHRTAKHTTKAKATKQLRLLRAVEHGWKGHKK